MAQDVPDDLHRRTKLDLPTSVAMTENVTAQRGSGQTRRVGVLADRVPNGRRTHWAVRLHRGDEDVSRRRPSRATILDGPVCHGDRRPGG